jgi:hypothetical protein
MSRLATFLLAGLSVLCSSGLHAENLPADHPAAEVVKSYLGFVTEQNWLEAAKLVKPAAIERKRAEAIATLKNAPTMSDEEAVLNKFGVKSIKELESLDLVKFFAADRTIFHSRAKEYTADVLKKKRESLKINVLGVVGEEGGKAAHLVLRTYQEVDDLALDELIFISAVNEDGKWVIAPDSMRPAVKSLKGGAAPATAPAGAGAGTDPK